MSEYQSFLDSKRIAHTGIGFDIDESDLNSQLFDWQKQLVSWALKKGRAAIFADCGLGKTPMQLEWAHQVAERSGGNVLILTPLAVSRQTVAEGKKFGIECNRSQDGTANRITVTNYERLAMFNPRDFSGVVCDESSILKNFDGSRRNQITRFMGKMPYRLLCTATAAPNDYIELGTSSEALGAMGYMDMLNYFFKNDQHNCATRRAWARDGGGTAKWRFKRHAETPFWRWVCSWSRALRKPSDIGFDDSGFTLPNLIENEIVVSCSRPLPGRLFVEPATNLSEQRAERRYTLTERCERVAEIIKHNGRSVSWCHLNDEADLLEKLIPNAKQVKGGMPDDTKEAILEDFTSGNLRVLITKPKIAGFGLNWQHCSHMTFFPSHSYEQYYQGVRRCWRFGQTRPVTVDVVTSEGEISVLENLQRKAMRADNMFSTLVELMNDSMEVNISDEHKLHAEVPSWL